MSFKVIEGPKWAVARSDLFNDSLARQSVVFPDLGDKLNKFLETKKDDPINARYGKHDRRLTGDLAGFWHCHLRDDAILIYRLSGRTMTLVYVSAHAEIEGKRLKQTAKRLHQLAA